MGDNPEPHITPETPGKPSVRNPFESPNDYHHLREPLVPSPSVFKLSQDVSHAPPGFNWSIDDMASLLPVHIDQEEIQRQSFYLSQTRTDFDIEEKRQNAIEQFFTKGAIVPSPWSMSDTQKAPHIYKTGSLSPMIEEQEKKTVACQTSLSLPLGFDLERLLGEYYRSEEATSDASQESLSSSSLRRKLFLDGQGSCSGSDSSSPPSPERGHSREERPLLTQNFVGQSAIFSSPLSCSVSASTPSTGQFSSSPIQTGCFRDSSNASPLFPDRSSPASTASPTISPIVVCTLRTPTGSAEWKRPCSLTPHSVPLDVDLPSFTMSPDVEGCSPIRTCSLHQHHPRANPRPRFRCCTTPPLISSVLNPRLPDPQEAEVSPSVLSVEPDRSSFLAQDNSAPNAESSGFMEPVKMEKDQESRMDGKLEEEDEEGDNGGLPGRLTSSRMGNVSAMETSQIFVSLLAERSSIFDSSMQVDSGYQTTSTGAGSLIDGLGSDYHGKESFSANIAEDTFHLNKPSKVKVRYPHQ
ncbi:protein aurora borealis isoform X1 [Phyllopteryx taeniolatus]|uniref:protein aurora borealis isoform X1 n=1 Tax=Phyllopteryx taeniolatus TaxID=161469 RepID=UPI002AD2D1FB|nr:protein aurora borealis isoform X1 [Phyllopteryx taeniolatus]